jgi:hypothetical protein
MALVTLLIAVSTVAWSLAGAAAGEAVALAYIWVAALRVLGQRQPSPRAAIAPGRAGVPGGGATPLAELHL